MRSFVLSMTAFVLVACAATSDPLCDHDVCTTPDGGGPPPNTEDECIGDPTNPTCATDANALFVNLSASTVGADGTQAHPYAAINAAMDHVTATRRRVYVCPGTYDAPHVLANGASLYGGLGCDWKKSGEKPTIVNNAGTAITIKNAKYVVVSDIVISSSAESATPGASATGVVVSKSSNVTLQRLEITSGPGIKAAETPATAPNYDVAKAADGGAAGNPNGGLGATCTCKDGTSSAGGRGSDYSLTNPPNNQTSGTANPPVGTDNKATACNGGVGLDGLRPEKPTPTIPIGSITEDGWTPAPARSSGGLGGRPGQGGGGALSSNPNGGSGGGCGGCGGTGGAGAAPGGSSFGIVVFQSTKVSITDTAIKTGSGAAGGNGATGQSGQKPGGGGAAVTCKGARGGYGSGGAGGTGGHGGHSIAIAYVGDLPFVAGGTRTTSDPGMGGPGGKGGIDNPDLPDHDPQNGGFDGDPGTPGSKEDISQLAN